VAKKKSASRGTERQDIAAGIDAVAERVGTSLGDLMNRRDDLMRQLSVLERQIAEAGRRASLAVVSRLKPAAPKRSAKPKTGNRKRKRPLPPDTPMVQATTRASAADAKARAATRARTSVRSGNR
jgi:hypothetical protein